MNYIENIKERVKAPTETGILTEDMMWQYHDTLIWKAQKFVGDPKFYLVYRYKDYYSYSMLALILFKNELNLDPNAAHLASQPKFEMLDQDTFIDLDIKRIGSKSVFSKKITDSDDYCEKLVEALKLDIREVEDKNQGFLNVIMCGGKDSLNLLLLPWKNPVMAVSAEPNYDLVCDFVRDNELGIEVRRLEDSYDDVYLQEEIAELCCRLDSVHWRWAHHVRNIARENNQKVVVWKGQIGDAFMSSRWKTYIFPEKPIPLFLCKLYNKLSPFMPSFIAAYLGKFIVERVEETLWSKGAILQGAHMGFMRALCDCLVLSAYHGKHIQKVILDVSLEKAVQSDIRMKIGEKLFGNVVKYPTKNPSPPLSTVRAGAHNPELFISLLTKHGVKVVTNDH